MNLIKTLDGYTNQARWFAANIDAGDGIWPVVGYAVFENKFVKYVYALRDGSGRKVIVVDGLRKTKLIYEVTTVFEQEDAAWGSIPRR